MPDAIKTIVPPGAKSKAKDMQRPVITEKSATAIAMINVDLKLFAS